MPKPMNKEMGGKPKMSGDQMKVLGRVMKYMLKNIYNSSGVHTYSGCHHTCGNDVHAVTC